MQPLNKIDKSAFIMVIGLYFIYCLLYNICRCHGNFKYLQEHLVIMYFSAFKTWSFEGVGWYNNLSVF